MDNMSIWAQMVNHFTQARIFGRKKKKNWDLFFIFFFLENRYIAWNCVVSERSYSLGVHYIELFLDRNVNFICFNFLFTFIILQEFLLFFWYWRSLSRVQLWNLHFGNRNMDSWLWLEIRQKMWSKSRGNTKFKF